MYHNGQAFTTKDRDNDEQTGNCGIQREGAWWYKSCAHSNLNGVYMEGEKGNAKGIQWNKWKSNDYSMKSSSMKLRRL